MANKCMDCEFKCVPFITRKNGFRDYAYKRGFKCWPITNSVNCLKHKKSQTQS